MVCALVACTSDGERSGTKRERVNAVAAHPAETIDPTGMCDVSHGAADAPAFAWPELTGDAPALSGGSWHWVNLWATWCKPCLDELPRLTAWTGELGDRVALHLVSADESDDDAAAFRREHPKTPAGVRMADPEALQDYLESLGLKGGSLPVHVFIRDQKIRCVRASAVEDTDFASVRALVR